MSDADGDDLVFMDVADGSEPAAPLPEPEERPRPPSAASGPRAAARRAAQTKQDDAWARRARSPEEQAQALDALRAQAKPVAQGEDPYLGRELGPFRAEELIRVERGLRVYLGTHAEQQEQVLLRVYPLVGSYADEFRRLAERGERACRLAHPSLSRCQGAIKSKESFFTGHELPLGTPVGRLPRDDWEEAEVLTLLEQIGQSLQALHGRSLVHGDVSLDTVVQERPGSYVLVDAGLARSRPEFAFLSAGGDLLGSPGFVAPETVDTAEVTPEAEVYALGCVAWNLLAGRPPVAGEDAVQLLLDQLNRELPSLGSVQERKISPDLVTLVDKMTGYTRGVRYRSMGDVMGELRALKGGRALKPFPPEVVAPPQELTPADLPGGGGGGKLLLVLLLLLNLGLLAGVVGSYLSATAQPLEDPLARYELPLPGVSEGGFVAPEQEIDPRSLFGPTASLPLPVDDATGPSPGYDAVDDSDRGYDDVGFAGDESEGFDPEEYEEFEDDGDSLRQGHPDFKFQPASVSAGFHVIALIFGLGMCGVGVLALVLGGRTKRGGRSRGQVHLGEALGGGLVDFKGNALTLMLALFILSVVSVVVAGIGQVGMALLVATGSVPLMVLGGLANLLFQMAASVFFWLGLIALSLNISRSGSGELGLVFSQGAGVLSGIGLQALVVLICFLLTVVFAGCLVMSRSPLVLLVLVPVALMLATINYVALFFIVDQGSGAIPAFSAARTVCSGSWLPILGFWGVSGLAIFGLGIVTAEVTALVAGGSPLLAGGVLILFYPANLAMTGVFLQVFTRLYLQASGQQ